MDLTIISALSSTKNKGGKAAGYECQFSENEQRIYFGYKAHVGVDKNWGMMHTVEITAANEHDVTLCRSSCTTRREPFNGNSGYIGADKREDAVVKNK